MNAKAAAVSENLRTSHPWPDHEPDVVRGRTRLVRRRRLPNGCERAARCGVTADRVINTRPLDDLLAWTVSR
jgi:hypothetical protein